MSKSEDDKKFLLQTFSVYNKKMGRYVRAFIDCERKKRQIIFSRNYILPGDTYKTDAELCELFSHVQNHIFHELVFTYISHSQITKLLDGTITTGPPPKNTKSKRTTKKNKKSSVKKVKGGVKGKSNKKKNKRNKKTEYSIGGGGFDFTKLRHVISLLLLFSLKAFTENSLTISNTPPHTVPGIHYTTTDGIYVGSTNTDGIDIGDEAQMKNYTERFGQIQHQNLTPLRSANLTKEFHKPNPSFFFQLSSSDFKDEVNKETIALYNDHVYPLHETIMKLCNIFIAETNDENPDELYGEHFLKIMEMGKWDHEKNRAEFLRNAKITIDNSAADSAVAVRTWSEYAGFLTTVADNEDSVFNLEQTDEILKLGTAGLATLAAKFDRNHDQKTKQSIWDNDVQSLFQLNRRKYLYGICDFALKPAELKYVVADETMYFFNYPYQRSHLDVLIRNVKQERERNVLTGSENDNDKINKQIEVAGFLENVLMQFDNGMRDLVTKGHHGKKSIADYMIKFGKRIDAIHEFAKMGLNGAPDSMKNAFNEKRNALANRDASVIELEALEIEEDMNNQTRTAHNMADDKYYTQLENDVTRVFMHPLISMVKFSANSFDIAWNYAMIKIVILLLGGLTCAGTLAYIRKLLPWYYNSLPLTTTTTTNTTPILLAPPPPPPPPLLAIVEQPALPLRNNYTLRQQKLADATRIFDHKPGVLRAPSQNGRCPKGFAWSDTLLNCAPSDYISTKKKEKHFIRWYNSEEDLVYTPELTTTNVLVQLPPSPTPLLQT